MQGWTGKPWLVLAGLPLPPHWSRPLTSIPQPGALLASVLLCSHPVPPPSPTTATPHPPLLFFPLLTSFTLFRP